MNQDVVATIAIPGMFAWFAWVIFSTIRRYKIAKLQAEVQTKLLDKVGSGQELLAYAQTEAGRELLESLKVERVSPHGRIIGALLPFERFVPTLNLPLIAGRTGGLRKTDGSSTSPLIMFRCGKRYVHEHSFPS
jgi:hypothetical protein